MVYIKQKRNYASQGDAPLRKDGKDLNIYTEKSENGNDTLHKRFYIFFRKKGKQ